MTFSRNWLEQSEAAKAKGVCHTEDECKLMYSEIPPEKKEEAIKSFRASAYAPTFSQIREAVAAEPDGWNVPYHLGWGMGVRNFFRQEGFGEEYFGVDNLDCIYVFLIEDAVRER
jgi:hypothetical protein